MYPNFSSVLEQPPSQYQESLLVIYLQTYIKHLLSAWVVSISSTTTLSLLHLSVYILYILLVIGTLLHGADLSQGLALGSMQAGEMGWRGELRYMESYCVSATLWDTSQEHFLETLQAHALRQQVKPQYHGGGNQSSEK